MRLLERIAFVIVAMALVLAATDWLVWQVRAHLDRNFGGGFGSVTITRMVIAPLKGNREEYYADGSTEERCSRSILPWGDARPCWYVNRHRTVVAR